MSLMRRIGAGFEALRLITKLEAVLLKPTGPFSRHTGQVVTRVIDGDTLFFEPVETALARKVGALRSSVAGALWRDVDRLGVDGLVVEGDDLFAATGLNAFFTPGGTMVFSGGRLADSDVVLHETGHLGGLAGLLRG
ncbi:MAG: hypothetical protein HYW02_01170 [Deltaproteobacteria bacterium]|nr:hypothetical protein [Deltaproteobacteria bacterium]MBI2500092.1 hypothetical protein [Deltaproteobacteria bacterium]